MLADNLQWNDYFCGKVGQSLICKLLFLACAGANYYLKNY